MVIAFFLIYYCLYRLYVKNAVLAEDLPAAVIPEDTSIEETLRLSEPRLPLIIDESSFEINLVEYLNEDNWVHSNTSDYRAISAIFLLNL